MVADLLDDLPTRERRSNGRLPTESIRTAESRVTRQLTTWTPTASVLEALSSDRPICLMKAEEKLKTFWMPLNCCTAINVRVTYRALRTWVMGDG